jgi:thioredoxin 1
MVHLIEKAEDFRTAIKSEKLSVVDAYATWCGPCKAIAPKLVEYSKKYEGANFLKLDVDDLSELAAELGIRAMPTFLFFKNGERVDEVVGADPAKLERTIQAHL